MTTRPAVRDVLARLLAGTPAIQADSALSGNGTADSQPEGLTASERGAMRRARTLSTVLDDAIRLPGIGYRVGLDPIFGILPVVGDSIPTVLSLYPIAEAYRFDATRRTLATMLLLVGIDAVIGSIPLLGTIFDAVWKANKWNVGILERVVDEH